MKTALVLGMGRFGRHAAHTLFDLGHQVMAVDVQESAISEVTRFVNSAEIGDTTDPKFMEQLGVDNFDLCIVAIGDDFQSSLETTALLKDLGAKFVVARAARDVHAKFLARNGADRVVYPERQLGEWTAYRYSSDHLLDFIQIDSENAVYEVPVPLEWVGKTATMLDVRRRYHINIIGVKKNGITDMMFSAAQDFPKDASLLVIGKYKDVRAAFGL